MHAPRFQFSPARLELPLLDPQVARERSREVFARGGQTVEVSGPHLEKQARAVHEGFWD